jgi:hypothetical protein
MIKSLQVLNPQTVTLLLQGVRRGDQEALNELLPMVYSQSREMADRALRSERGGHPLEGGAPQRPKCLRQSVGYALACPRR